MPTTSDIEHLLRRTEFVARPNRVSELSAKPTLAGCVDDVLATSTNPGSASLTASGDWPRGEQYTYYWFDQMAHDSARPAIEKVALFWHGHFCSSLWKVELAEPMRQQIDIFRYEGLGNFRSLAKRVSTQPAMLRYLDNDQNVKSSPNQNFARELMELFVLGVGNYREADVEAAAAAWTGHTYIPQTGEALWRGEHHDASSKSFHGRTINVGGDPTQHGVETIDVMLGSGVVQSGAARNVGRSTSDVAIEFISRKMWTYFAGTTAPDTVLAAMRSAAIASDLDIRTWLRAMLVRPEFYADDVKNGLVRSPVDFMVAALVATGLRANPGIPLWLLDGMGQRPLLPPDVSGWKHNEYFTNASAMANRSLAVRYIMWNTMLGFWAGDGLIHLAGGTISHADAIGDTHERFVDRVLSLMRLNPSAASREVLYRHARSQPVWSERVNLVALAMLMPDFHLA